MTLVVTTLVIVTALVVVATALVVVAAALVVDALVVSALVVRRLGHLHVVDKRRRRRCRSRLQLGRRAQHGAQHHDGYAQDDDLFGGL